MNRRTRRRKDQSESH